MATHRSFLNSPRGELVTENNDLNPAGGDYLWTIEEVAQYLRLEPDTVRVLARERKIPAIKMGRVWRFHQDAVREWVASQTRSSL